MIQRSSVSREMARNSHTRLAFQIADGAATATLDSAFTVVPGVAGEIQVRLSAWLDLHYHQAPHGGLMGRTPMDVYLPEAREIERVDEAVLKKALVVTETRRVRRDTTVSLDGRIFELDRGWLAGRRVDVSWSALDKPIAPWAEYEGKRFELHPVDPEKNASRKRPPRLDAPPKKPTKPVSFDPPKALLDRALRNTATPESHHDQ